MVSNKLGHRFEKKLSSRSDFVILKSWSMVSALKPAPYLVGVLGVLEHPRNLGVQERAKPDFCFLDFSYYYEYPRIQKAKYGTENRSENYNWDRACISVM